MEKQLGKLALFQHDTLIATRAAAERRAGHAHLLTIFRFS